MKAIVSGCVAALCLAASGWAQAQQSPHEAKSGEGAYEHNAPLFPHHTNEFQSGEGSDEGTAVPERTPADIAAQRHHLQTGLDMSFLAGFSDFTGSLGSRTNVGLSWGARAGYAVTPNIGVELGYVGANNRINDPALTEDHHVVTTGANADIKLMAPIGVGNSAVLRPYAFAGGGGAYYGITGENPPNYDSDSTIQIPVGGGADVLVGKFGATESLDIGARFDYLFGIANSISPNTNGDQYSVNGNIGLHF